MLLLQVAEGNEMAFRKLIGEHADFLLTYLTRLTKERELAEEIVQDVFLKIWEARDYLANVDHFKNYLFIISRNQALKVLDKVLTLQKKHARWQELQSHPEEGSPSEKWFDLVEQAARQLPSQQQRVWIMSRREGKTYADIALALGLSKETVKYYMKLATASITSFLREHANTMMLAFLIFKK